MKLDDFVKEFENNGYTSNEPIIKYKIESYTESSETCEMTVNFTAKLFNNDIFEFNDDFEFENETLEEIADNIHANIVSGTLKLVFDLSAFNECFKTLKSFNYDSNEDVVLESELEIYNVKSELNTIAIEENGYDWVDINKTLDQISGVLKNNNEDFINMLLGYFNLTLKD